MKPAVWMGAAFVALVFGFIVYSSLHSNPYRCEICLTFNGRTECRTAGAQSREHAQRTAVENACALLAAGVTETSQCEQTRPDSVRWIE
jgi:hypothetical protein